MSANSLQKVNDQLRVLVIDNDSEILAGLKSIFDKAGFSVRTSTNGRNAIEEAKKFVPHLVILELALPGVDGIEICQELKQVSSLEKTLIVFYSIRTEDYSQIAAFSAGADDYIIKPLNENVLLLRIQALFKRHIVKKQNKILHAGNISMDRERYVVMKGDETIILPKKEFELLALLIGSPKKVFTRKDIFREIWGEETGENSRTIDVHIRKIREKIGDDLIKTVKGVGYSFKLN